MISVGYVCNKGERRNRLGSFSGEDPQYTRTGVGVVNVWT